MGDQSLHAGRVVSLCNQAADHLADATSALNESPDNAAWAVVKLALALRCLGQCEADSLEMPPLGPAHIVWCPPGFGWRMEP